MALTNKLTAIGDAIRNKTGSTNLLTLDEMPTAIESIEGGGGGGEFPEEAFVVEGNGLYRFAHNGWNWYINNYADRITTRMYEGNYMFGYSSGLTEIPFAINFDVSDRDSKYSNVSSMFQGCINLTKLPKVNNVTPADTKTMFANCSKLREIPEDFGSNWNWNYMDKQTTSYACSRANMFDSCYSLRKISKSFISHTNPIANYINTIYYNGFKNCYVLEELELPVLDQPLCANNMFPSMLDKCYRLSKLVFATNEDGTPKVVRWKAQTIDLTNNVGYLASASYASAITSYNSGITADKLVSDDESYQRLKNDPDWFGTYAGTDAVYSRYDHDSAVETINSLPDASAYLATQTSGTNTIKFKGYAGLGTDAGAINTLTEEEIAVATAKGWTVTFS